MFGTGEAAGHIPKVQVIPGGIGWLHLMWIPSVRPENEQPVKEWLDVGYHWPTLREDLQQAAMHLGAGQMRLLVKPLSYTAPVCPPGGAAPAHSTRHSLPPLRHLKRMTAQSLHCHGDGQEATKDRKRGRMYKSGWG